MTRRNGQRRGVPYSAWWLAAGAVVLVAVFGGRQHFHCYGFATTGDGSGVRRDSLRKNSVHASETVEGGVIINIENDTIQSQQRRRVALNKILRTSIAIVMTTCGITSSTTAQALDMDAFESSILSKDATTDLSPKLNDDEALCKYGAPGKAMGEACSRAKMQRKLPGKVDVTGKVDRGDYLKCRYEYPIIGGEYVKTRVCKPSGEEW